jgi:hypothetical protein
MRSGGLVHPGEATRAVIEDGFVLPTQPRGTKPTGIRAADLARTRLSAERCV